MNRLIAIAISMAVALFISPCALAQTAAQSKVYATCGSAAYLAGTSASDTQDTTGKKCVNATVNATVSVAPLTSTNLSGTIAVTNTFQSIQASTAGRNGCLIQNQSTTNPMYVYFGAIGVATKAKSFILDTAHGLAISCSVGGLGVLTDQVSITGTAADGFTANFQ